ncbi:MAG: hypothetical protein Q8O61_01755 [Nocardioides sp.]|nr:hypothetical protein [Nocardioides sp.]
MRRPRLTYANVASTLALTVALGTSSAYAAGLVTSRDIKNDTIRSVDIANRTIKQKDVAPGTLGSQSVKDRSIKKRDLADAVVSDVERVRGTDSSGSGTWARATAACPAGKDLIGATAHVGRGGHPFVALHAIEQFTANPDRRAVALADAHEHVATDVDWNLTVVGVCAFVGAPVSGPAHDTIP